MPRPRTPSKVLELRGAYVTHPERRREDAPGSGPANLEPPSHLPTDVAPAWRYVVARLPRVCISASDEILIESAARLLADVWSTRRADPRLYSELRSTLAALGMSPQARTRLPAALPPAKPTANPFERFKRDEDP